VVIDGVDLGPALADPAASLGSRAIFLQWHRGNGQQRYRNYAVVRDRWKLHRPSVSAPDELYDLSADPGEKRDVAADHPEVVEALRAEYDAWFDDVSTTRPDNWAAPRIVVGDPAVGTVVLSRQDWRIDDAVADMGELAGWLGTTAGWWEVDVAAGGRLDAVVRLEPFTWARPDLFSAVTLRVGDREWSVPAVLQCTRYELTVDLEPGPTEIEAWATGGPNGRTSALYVDLAPQTTRL
jgi:arylsulfatase/arylsulfatase A